MPEFAKIVIVVVSIIVFGWVVYRTNKHFHQTNLYIMGVAVGWVMIDILINSACHSDYYLVAVGVCVICAIVNSVVKSIIAFNRRRPIIIIDDGIIDYHNLKRSRLNINDILDICKEQGFLDIAAIEYAILEDNCRLSIVTKGNINDIIVYDKNTSKLDN